MFALSFRGKFLSVFFTWRNRRRSTPRPPAPSHDARSIVSAPSAKCPAAIANRLPTLDRLAASIGGPDNVCAIFVCRKDGVQPLCWIANDFSRVRGPGLTGDQILYVNPDLSNLLYKCGFTQPTADGQPSGAGIVHRSTFFK